MSDNTVTSGLFPNFVRFVTTTGLLDKAKGNLAAKIPRILGQGNTRADRLAMPPAIIERKQELATLTFPAGYSAPPEVAEEIDQAKLDVEKLKAELRTDEGIRRFAVGTLQNIQGPPGYSGIQDGHYYADRLILGWDKSGMEWSWSITPYYPIIKNIPPNVEYLLHAFDQARNQVKAMTMPDSVFEKRLELAWTIARQVGGAEDVLVLDVMKMFRVAAQDDRFWQSPQKKFFTDWPEGYFVVNLLNWRLHSPDSSSKFEFVPATLNQASGKDARVFYLPMNRQGTEVRPMIHMRRRQAS